VKHFLKFAPPPSGGNELLEFTPSHEEGDSGNRESYDIEDSCKKKLMFVVELRPTLVRPGD